MEYGNGILVCGHRGDRVWGRENTLGAFRMAAEAGVDMVEADVRMTADGTLILMHDAAVDRTTDGTGLVRELTLEQIRRLNAAVHSPFPPEPPALLEELLELAKGQPELLLNIELKDHSAEVPEDFAFLCCDRTAQMLADSGMGSRIWINSFDGRLLERVWKGYGDTFHYHGFYPWFIMGQMETDPETFVDVACMQHRYQLPDGSIHRYEEPLCPKEWFDSLLEKGIMPLMAPSLREYSKYDLAFSWGSRIVNPDDPYAMLRRLREQGRHK